MTYPLLQPPLPMVADALQDVYSFFGKKKKTATLTSEGMPDLWGKDQVGTKERPLKENYQEKPDYIRSHVFTLGRPPTSDGMG